MSRKKKPEFDSNVQQEQLINAVVKSYFNPALGEEVSPILDAQQPRKQLTLLAKEYHISLAKARKLLITAGVYEPQRDKEKLGQIQKFYAEGKRIEEIAERMDLSRATVHSYLPYSKVVYKTEEISVEAERVKHHRTRKRLQQAIEQQTTEQSREQSADTQRPIDVLWKQLIAYQGYTFYTSKGLDFTYTVKGREIFFSRKEKSVTKASVEIALAKAIELDGKVSGPKKLTCHGSSYLYPIFAWLGLVDKKLKEPHKRGLTS